MRSRFFRVSIALALSLASLVGARIYAAHRLQTRTLHARPQSSKTPLQYGAPYQELSFSSEGRRLQAFYVAPPAGSRASLLLFHGNDESIASWAPVQGYLYAHGLGSMVFDYSGFGRSEGALTLDHAAADGLAAWSEFKSRLPAGTRACAYGLSLGTGVLLEDAAKFAPPPDGLIVYGSFTSALGAGARMHQLPAWAVPLLPAAHLPAPLLVLHGERDEKFPLEDGRAIAAAAHARFVALPGFTHAQPLLHPDDAGWLEAVAFARGEQGN